MFLVQINGASRTGYKFHINSLMFSDPHLGAINECNKIQRSSLEFCASQIALTVQEDDLFNGLLCPFPLHIIKRVFLKNNIFIIVAMTLC